MRKKKRPVAVVLGTRPEIIKLAPVIRGYESRCIPYFVIHTGQHYSYEMDRIFFRDLELPDPRYQLHIRSEGNLHADHTGRMMEAVEKILVKENPRAVLVQGDTNTVLAASLAASKIPGIKIGHVEAGLRSYDRRMPEEINRVLSDHVAHFLFAPTVDARSILLSEGLSKKNIFVTGNTIVDAVRQNLAFARRKEKGPLERGLKRRKFFLMTLHRQENVDNKKTLSSITEGLKRVIREFRLPILFSIHPRTRERLRRFGLELPREIRAMAPVGFLDFLRLEESAAMILTGSGGLQEEACILGVPCVTLRTSTERPETVRVGANRIAGHDPVEILQAAKQMFKKPRDWQNPFGDGRASERILRIVEKSAS